MFRSLSLVGLVSLTGCARSAGSDLDAGLDGSLVSDALAGVAAREAGAGPPQSSDAQSGPPDETADDAAPRDGDGRALDPDAARSSDAEQLTDAPPPPDAASVDPNCNPGCIPENIGDGLCRIECNLAACNFDGGDCAPAPECAPGCLAAQIEDAVCQPACDVEACDFDGGDCGERCGESPVAPTDLHAVRQGDTPADLLPVRVSWTYDGSPVTGFRVSRLDPGEDAANGALWDNVGGSLAAAAREFLDHPPENGGRYSYRVRAFLDTGACERAFGPYSNTDDAIP